MAKKKDAPKKEVRTTVKNDIQTNFQKLISPPVYIHSNAWNFEYAMNSMVSQQIGNITSAFREIVDRKIKSKIAGIILSLSAREKDVYDMFSNGSKEEFLNYFRIPELMEAMSKNMDKSENLAYSLIKYLSKLKNAEAELSVVKNIAGEESTQAKEVEKAKEQLKNKFRDILKKYIKECGLDEVNVDKMGDSTIATFDKVTFDSKTIKAMRNLLDPSSKVKFDPTAGTIIEPFLGVLFRKGIIGDSLKDIQVIADSEQGINTTDLAAKLEKDGRTFTIGFSAKTGKSKIGKDKYGDTFTNNKVNQAIGEGINKNNFISSNVPENVWNTLLYTIYNAKVFTNGITSKIQSVVTIFWLIQELMGWKELLSAAIGRGFEAGTQSVEQLPLFLLGLEDIIPMSDFLFYLYKLDFNEIGLFLPWSWNTHSRFMKSSLAVRKKAVGNNGKLQKLVATSRTASSNLFDQKKSYIQQNILNGTRENINYVNLKNYVIDTLSTLNDALQSDLGYSVSYRINIENLKNLRS